MDKAVRNRKAVMTTKWIPGNVTRPTCLSGIFWATWRTYSWQSAVV
jgi:hypothetical protein